MNEIRQAQITLARKNHYRQIKIMVDETENIVILLYELGDFFGIAALFLTFNIFYD